MSAEEVQISCKFVTRLPEQYRIAPTPIAVPGKLTRYGLSEVINHLLNAEKPTAFDFVTEDGSLLRGSLAKYLIVIARRVVIRELRQRRATEQAKPLTTDVVANSSDGSRVENRDLVQRMLKGLSGTDAEVVRQFHLEGRSYREISSQLGVPENTIGPLLTRARERLREAGAADVR